MTGGLVLLPPAHDQAVLAVLLPGGGQVGQRADFLSEGKYDLGRLLLTSSYNDSSPCRCSIDFNVSRSSSVPRAAQVDRDFDIKTFVMFPSTPSLRILHWTFKFLHFGKNFSNWYFSYGA